MMKQFDTVKDMVANILSFPEGKPVNKPLNVIPLELLGHRLRIFSILVQIMNLLSEIGPSIFEN